jgi:hypothetical protein
MARLEDALLQARNADQVVRLSESRGERLFDEQIDAGLEQLRRYGVMMNRGNGDGGRVEAKIGSQQLRRRRIDRDLVLGGGFRGAGGVGLDAGNQGDAEPGVLKLAVDTEMIAAKGAGAGNSNAQNGRARYFPAPLPSTACRQRV